MQPKKLILINFLSHSYSEIDFTQFDLALIIGSCEKNLDSSNGCGKSSIFEAISWALFGKTRHKRKDGVVKYNSVQCEVIFEFVLNNEYFKIHRKRNKVVSQSDVILYQLINNLFVDISCDTNSLTDEKIIDILKMNYDIFINSIYFKQKDVLVFIDSSSSKRKDILKNILKLDKWDKYYNCAQNHHKNISINIDNIKSRLLPLNKICNKIDNTTKELKYTETKLLEQNKLYTNLYNKILQNKLDLGKEENNNNIKLSKLEELKKNFKNNTDIINKYNQEYLNNSNNIKTNLKNLEKLKKYQSKLNKEIQLKNKINLPLYNKKLNNGKIKLLVLQDKINTLKNQINKTNCNFCHQFISKDLCDQLELERKTSVQKNIDQYTRLKLKITRAEKKYKELETLVKKSFKLESERDQINLQILHLKNLLTIYKNKNIDIKNKINKFSKMLYTNEIKILEQSILSLSSVVEKDKIDQDYNNLNILKKEMDDTNIKYGKIKKTIEELQLSYLEQKQLYKNLEELIEKQAIYNHLKDYFGRNGIQAVIIENIIGELENYTNNVLSKICTEPTTISIVTQKQTDNGSSIETFDIEVTRNGQTDDLESLSGGELFRIALALRLSLSNILFNYSGNKMQFLLLDEVSSWLDNKGTEMFINIIKQLSKDIKILVISHNEKIKEQFENIIYIEKIKGNSTVI